MTTTPHTAQQFIDAYPSPRALRAHMDARGRSAVALASEFGLDTGPYRSYTHRTDAYYVWAVVNSQRAHARSSPGGCGPHLKERAWNCMGR